MTFDWGYAWEILPAILRGAVVTIKLGLAIYAVALVGGLILAVVRLALTPALAHAVDQFTSFIRTTPPLIQLYVPFFILPQYGIVLSAEVTGVAVLGLHLATFTSEVYRAGIEAVPRTQWEAAIAIGLDPRRTWMRIILPLAARKVVPPLGNYLIGTIKSVPYLAVISVQDMLGAALNEASLSFRYYEPIALVGALYLVMSLIAAELVRFVERRYAAV